MIAIRFTQTHSRHMGRWPLPGTVGLGQCEAPPRSPTVSESPCTGRLVGGTQDRIHWMLFLNLQVSLLRLVTPWPRDFPRPRALLSPRPTPSQVTGFRAMQACPSLIAMPASLCLHPITSRILLSSHPACRCHPIPASLQFGVGGCRVCTRHEGGERPQRQICLHGYRGRFASQPALVTGSPLQVASGSNGNVPHHTECLSRVAARPYPGPVRLTSAVDGRPPL
jgi:hypothetical protein